MSLPRFPLLRGPTPTYELPRLRAALGGSERCPKILIKRDDLAGPALGGNKSRKLEYVVADALAKHATHLITVGGVQSNHARMTAAAARLAELSCVLVLTAKDAGPAPSPQGNLLLDEVLGAEVHFVPPGPEALGANPHEDKCIAGIVGRLEKEGKRPYVIALGASTPLGVLGYVDAMGELLTQVKELGERPTRLYFGAGSRGTQAGIVLGTVLHGAPWTPHGVAVSPGCGITLSAAGDRAIRPQSHDAKHAYRNAHHRKHQAFCADGHGRSHRPAHVRSLGNRSRLDEGSESPATEFASPRVSGLAPWRPPTPRRG